MIVSNIENPFFLDIFRSTEAIALDRGYSVLLEQTGYTASRLVASVRSMLGRRVCGLAVIVSEMEPGLIDELSQREIPVVIYDVGHPARNISSIRVRYEIGIQRVVEYLYSLGHRRMAFVGHHARLAPLQARRKTFTKAVRKFASGADYTIVEESDTPAGGRQAAHRLLESGFAPTAILCVNDIMAVGVLRELRERGLRVPEDVSVTGFDNIQLAEYTSPALTTVNIPRAEIGRYCFEAIAPLDGVLGIDRDVVIYPELVVRESTGRAKGAAQ
jgi:DNA-binding LacI/PurR family transcriptional regulator